MTTELVLRYEPLREELLQEIMEIETEAYPEAWTIGMFRDEMRNRLSRFYVAFLGDALAGYGGFWLMLDEAHITSVTIRDRFRRQGLGRQLMRHLLAEATQCGAKSATLEVRESNVAAQNLYEQLGFQRVGFRKRYYPKSREDAIVMVRELAPAEMATPERPPRQEGTGEHGG